VVERTGIRARHGSRVVAVYRREVPSAVPRRIALKNSYLVHILVNSAHLPAQRGDTRSYSPLLPRLLTPLPPSRTVGIPKFYRWLSERYPLLNQHVSINGAPEIDNLVRSPRRLPACLFAASPS
jgi:hypothetical protein